MSEVFSYINFAQNIAANPKENWKKETENNPVSNYLHLPSHCDSF